LENKIKEEEENKRHLEEDEKERKMRRGCSRR
jgi:hypothetical protein